MTALSQLPLTDVKPQFRPESHAIACASHDSRHLVPALMPSFVVTTTEIAHCVSATEEEATDGRVEIWISIGMSTIDDIGHASDIPALSHFPAARFIRSRVHLCRGYSHRLPVIERLMRWISAHRSASLPRRQRAAGRRVSQLSRELCRGLQGQAILRRRALRQVPTMTALSEPSVRS